jgi:hypothetical protein
MNEQQHPYSPDVMCSNEFPLPERMRGGLRDLLGQALSHVRCYVPRNTMRASTAFTP